MQTPRTSALELIKLGLAVFPLKPKSKEPATAHGVKDATKDSAAVGEWAGVAVACGEPSGVIVVDIDPRNGGNEGMEALVIKHGPLPATWECLTGGGGRHLYFRGVCRTHKVIGGGAVDVRGTGSYVVAPPSIHPDTGKLYAWELSGVPGEIPLADAPAWLLAAPDAVHRGDPLGAPDAERLAISTIRFIGFGAPEGERNNKLFAAACDMAGCGFSFAATMTQLGPAATKSGLSGPETEKSIQSAFTSPRSPAVPITVIPEHLNGTPPVADTDKTPAANSEPAHRPYISNVVDAVRTGADGEKTPVTYAKPLAAIGDELLSASAGWPKAAGRILFVEEGHEPRWLLRTEELFAWMHETAVVRWHSGKTRDPMTKIAAIAPTKAEFFAHVRDSLAERYRAIARYPHEPPIEGLYYLLGEPLPPATGKHLDEFMAAFNPETELDRVLMRAALITPGAGLPPGTRPLFVISSRHGMGAGKTHTARAIGEVWGGMVDLDADEKWKDECKRIMSSEDREARCFLFDNIQGRFGGRGIEAAITAKNLSGHRMYAGTVSRPNDATYFAALNGPELSPDLAQRAVLIHVGAPKHNRDFVHFYLEYVREHGPNLIADCLAELRKPILAPWQVPHDRWQVWNQTVLGRLESGQDAARLIQERRPGADADAEERDQWLAMIGSQCARLGGCEAEVSAADIHKAAIEAKLWQPGRDKSETVDRQMCLRRAERLLAGTGAIEPKVSGARKALVTGADGVRSRVFHLSSQSVPEQSYEQALNIPI